MAPRSRMPGSRSSPSSRAAAVVGALILDDTVEEGVVRLRAAKALGGGAISARLAEGIVRHAIEAAAPEVTTIEIADLPVAPDPGLVQIRPRRGAP